MNKLHIIKLLMLVFGASLLATSCKNAKPNKDPKKETEMLEVAFRYETHLLSLNEEIPLSDLLEEKEGRDFDAKTLNVSVKDPFIAEISEGRLKAIKVGETTLTLQNDEKTSQLELGIQDFSKPFDASNDFFLKYIWDYKQSPQKIVNHSQRPVVMDFWADWCGPCKMIAPSIRNLAETYKGKLIVLKFDLSKPKGNKEFQVLLALRKSNAPEMEQIFNVSTGGYSLPTIVALSKTPGKTNVAVVGTKLTPIKNFVEKEFN